MSAIHLDPHKRHDFIVVYDGKDCNPNGDPDADNMPRTDPFTQHGIVTDVCLKRRIRDFIQTFGNEFEKPERYEIYVKEKSVLNDTHLRAYEALDLKPVKKGEAKDKTAKERIEKSREWMLNTFFDLRLMGGVLSTEVNCGAVHGAMQLTFGRSYDPVAPLVAQLTRCAVTNAKDEEKERTFGRRAWIPYGLYRHFGHYNAIRGKALGVTEADLEYYWEALLNMWDFDRSAARNQMAVQKLVIFSHDRLRGNALAHKLFERLIIWKHPEAVAREFKDYQVHINRENLPEGITITELV